MNGLIFGIFRYPQPRSLGSLLVVPTEPKSLKNLTSLIFNSFSNLSSCDVCVKKKAGDKSFRFLG